MGGRVNQGQAFVSSGADGRLLLTLDNPIPQADAAFGAAVAGTGDVNGDGLPDLLVGAPEQDRGSDGNRGEAFVFSGADTSLLRTLDDPNPDNLAGFGEVAAGIGDVDGDGAPDFLVGAPGHDVGGRVNQGRAFVVLSVALGPRTRVPCTIAGCRVRATCDLAPAFGIACTNPLRLLVDVPRRLAQDAAVKGQRQEQRRLRVFARSSATNVPPGRTANVRLRLTPLGRRIVMTSNANRLRGVIEIKNTPGTVIDTTRVRIRLRRR